MYTNGKEKTLGNDCKQVIQRKKKYLRNQRIFIERMELGFFQYISCISCCSFLEHLSKNMFWPKLDYIDVIWKVSCNVDSKLKRWECYVSWGWKNNTYMNVYTSERNVFNPFQQILKLIINTFWKLWTNMFVIWYMLHAFCAMSYPTGSEGTFDYRLHNWRKKSINKAF